MGWEDVDYTEAMDYKALAADTECELIIVEVRPNEERRSVMVTCEIANEDMTRSVITFVNYSPRSEEGEAPTPKAINAMKLGQRNFFKGFGVVSGDDNFHSCESWKGHRAMVILSKKEDAEFGASNKIKRYVKPVSESFTP